ncbi:MAG TPA: protoporphyrinogen oxidase [Bacteroidota bacterium]
MTGRRDVIIVGAGISGLTVAYFLRRAGVSVTVLDPGDVPGGTMQTVMDGEWMVETGPNSALETTPLFGEMFDGLGIAGERLYAAAAAERRYILRDALLHPLPMSPGAFLTSSLWSVAGKLRLMKEPFVGRGTEEETVAQFVRRRLGEEFLEYAINPFVAGVYAGDPAALSVRAAFPKLYALEERYGGLIRGMVRGAGERRKRAEKAKDRARMFSFRGGMQTFPIALGRYLGDGLRLKCTATSVGRNDPPGGGPAFVVRYRREGEPGSLEAPALVLAVPAYIAGDFVRPFSASLGAALERIFYPPVAEVFLGFPDSQVGRPLDGFGYLIPEKEKRKILGTIWSSVLFPGRAPAGHVALTTFVGGARQPLLAGLDDRDLIRTVASELRSLMGVTGDPVYAKIIRWEKAIPQYNLGHLALVEEIRVLERQVPGLYLCGNYRGGIAVGDCLMSGESLARRIAGEMQRPASGDPR